MLNNNNNNIHYTQQYLSTSIAIPAKIGIGSCVKLYEIRHMQLFY